MLRCLIAFALLATASSAQEIEFRFAPPEGTTYTTVTTLTRTVEGGGRTQKDEGEAVTRTVVSKIGSDYEMRHSQLSMSLKRDGQPVENRMAADLLKTTMTWTLGADGNIKKVEIEGPAQVDVASVTKREQSEWRARIGRLIGRKARIGGSWADKGDGYTITTTVQGIQPCGTARCARVSVSFNGERLEGSSELLVDPATGLLHSERIQRVLRSPGASITEVREFKYTFNPR